MRSSEIRIDNGCGSSLVVGLPYWMITFGGGRPGGAPLEVGAQGVHLEVDAGGET